MLQDHHLIGKPVQLTRERVPEQGDVLFLLQSDFLAAVAAQLSPA